MGVKEITSRIKSLQANALQDYLEIILRENNIDLSDWKQHYASFIESQRKKNYTSVAEVYKKISLNGIDSIDIKQLDTSAIINYVRFGKIPFKNKIEKEITLYLSLLQDDRNIDAHVNGNETTREIYQFAVTELAHLRDFIEYVWNTKKSEPMDERYEYRDKYSKKISKILLELDQCYRKEIIENEKSIKSRINKYTFLILAALFYTIGIYCIVKGIFQHCDAKYNEIIHYILEK